MLQLLLFLQFLLLLLQFLLLLLQFLLLLLIVVVFIELIVAVNPVHEGKTSFLTSNYLRINYLMLDGWLLCWMGGCYVGWVVFSVDFAF